MGPFEVRGHLGEGVARSDKQMAQVGVGSGILLAAPEIRSFEGILVSAVSKEMCLTVTLNGARLWVLSVVEANLQGKEESPAMQRCYRDSREGSKGLLLNRRHQRSKYVRNRVTMTGDAACSVGRAARRVLDGATIASLCSEDFRMVICDISAVCIIGNVRSQISTFGRGRRKYAVGI